VTEHGNGEQFLYIPGKVVSLRSIIASDFEHLKKWWSEPEANYYDSGDPEDLPTEEYLKNFHKKIGTSDLANWFIIENGEGVPVGYTNYRAPDFLNGTITIAIRLGKDFWNKGYGTAATRMLMKHLFDVYAFRKILLSVFQFNKRAIRVYEKCGFKKKELRTDEKGRKWLVMEAGRDDFKK